MIPFFDSTGMIYMHWIPTGQIVNKEYYVEVLREFRKRFRRKRPALFKSGQWHFHQDNAPVHYSILVTDYLTKMGIKTVLHPPYSPDVAPCDFCLFPKPKEKFRGRRYETIEEMKEAVRKVINTLKQEDFHGAFQNLLERSNKCIAAGWDYFEGDKSFMCVLSKKGLYEKSLETYSMSLVCINDLALNVYNGWYAIKPNQTKPNHIYLIYMYKEDLALNNQQWLICHITQSNQIIYI